MYDAIDVNLQEYVEFFMRNSARGDAAPNDNLLLPDWRSDDWARLIALTNRRTVRIGEFVINRNAMDRSLYFVVSGDYEVGIMQVGAAAIRPIATIGPGSVIGDQSFFDGQPRSANVWAASAGELLILEFDAYRRFAGAAPALAVDLLFALGRVLSMRLRSTTLLASG